MSADLWERHRSGKPPGQDEVPLHEQERNCPYCGGAYVNNGAAWAEHKQTCSNYREEMTMAATATSKKKGGGRKPEKQLNAEQKGRLAALVDEGKWVSEIVTELGLRDETPYTSSRGEQHPTWWLWYGAVKRELAIQGLEKPVKPKKVTTAKATSAAKVEPIKETAPSTESEPGNVTATENVSEPVKPDPKPDPKPKPKPRKRVTRKAAA